MQAIAEACRHLVAYSACGLMAHGNGIASPIHSCFALKSKHEFIRSFECDK